MEQLILLKGKLYELVFIVLSTAQGDVTLTDAYFMTEANTALGLGAKIVHTFDITHLEHADIEAQQVILVEWPNRDSLEKFHSSSNWHKTWPSYNKQIEALNTVHFTVVQDTKIAMSNDGLYEFAGFWMNKHNAHLMPQYFQMMKPVVQIAQPQPLAQLEVVNTNSPFDLKPDRFNIIKWNGGLDAREAMFNSKEFKESGYLRALALDRIFTAMFQSQ